MQMEGGLIRPSPEPAETVGGRRSCTTAAIEGRPLRRVYKRVTVKKRKVEREETRLETRNSDAQVVSSDVKRRESVEETIATKDLEMHDRGIRDFRLAEERVDATAANPGRGYR